MNQRFYSLDVFRGATVALMILVNNPGSWGYIFAPLEHAKWHGCTPTDLVFPFFLFAVGNAMAFVIPRLEEKNIFWQKVIKRTLLILIIGLLLNWFPFIKYNDAGSIVGKPFANLRLFGVLQRIALCYFFAAIIIHFFKTKGAFVVACILLLAYWFLCIAANPSNPFSISGWYGTALDVKLFGIKHIYSGDGVPFDPESLYSIFAAISQVIFGYLIGNYILTKGKTHEMLNGLFVAGCVFVFAGFCWDMAFPINKKIWSSSYTVYTTGLALIVLSVLIYLIEFKGSKGVWTKFFDVFGKNALFIFAMSNIVLKLMNLIKIKTKLLDETTGIIKDVTLSPTGFFFHKIGKVIFNDPKLASLLYAICFITLMWLLAWWMDKKKIYVKV